MLVKYNGESIDINIPDNVIEIGNSCFKHTKIKSIIIPDNVKVIGQNAFSECDELMNIIIPDSVKSIGENAFSKCYNLKSITIPKGCIVNSYAFSYCGNLETVYINDNAIVKKIAFCKTKLSTVFIGKNIKFEYNCFLDNNITSVKNLETGKYFDYKSLYYLIKVDEDGVKSLEGFASTPFGSELLSCYAKEHNLCQHCGRRFGGLLRRKCIFCGREKDYTN